MLCAVAYFSTTQFPDLIAELEKQKVAIPSATVRAAINKWAKEGTLLFESKTDEIRQL